MNCIEVAATELRRTLNFLHDQPDRQESSQTAITVSSVMHSLLESRAFYVSGCLQIHSFDSHPAGDYMAVTRRYSVNGINAYA